MGPILVSRAWGSKINQKMERDPQNTFSASERDRSNVPQVTSGVHPYARTSAHADYQSVSYPGNSRTNCAEILCVAIDQSAGRFTPVRVGVYLHVCQYVPLFRISGTAKRIPLKFSIWLDIK